MTRPHVILPLFNVNQGSTLFMTVFATELRPNVEECVHASDACTA